MSKAALFLALTFTLGLTGADSRRSYVNVPHQEGRIEIRSYGERSRDLLALLIPFFAKRDFSQVTLIPVDPDKEGAGIFFRIQWRLCCHGRSVQLLNCGLFLNRDRRRNGWHHSNRKVSQISIEGPRFPGRAPSASPGTQGR